MQREIKVLKKKLSKKQKQLKLCIDTVNELEIKISESRTDINQMVENMIKLQEEYDFGDEFTLNSINNNSNHKKDVYHETISL